MNTTQKTQVSTFATRCEGGIVSDENSYTVNEWQPVDDYDYTDDVPNVADMLNQWQSNTERPSDNEARRVATYDTATGEVESECSWFPADRRTW